MLRFLGVLILTGSIAGGWLWLEWQGALQQSVRVPEQGADYQIVPGQSFATVMRQLELQELIDKPRYLIWQARLDGEAHRIQAGLYHIRSGTTAAELISLFISGRVKETSFTIIEGWSFKELMAAIRAHPAISHELEGLGDGEVMARIGYPEQHQEGQFLPETYSFPEGTTDQAILKRAYESMQQRLQQEWSSRDSGLPLDTPYQALILASIVEKETGQASERPDVAGVFVRRLHKNMRLQTDPTVIYGMGDRFDGNIRRKDLREDTPYNTYVHKGLPPTPIAMPGIAAIRAALHPASGDSLYFVARGDGSHKFSATLKEHQAAVREYQLKKR